MVRCSRCAACVGDYNSKFDKTRRGRPPGRPAPQARMKPLQPPSAREVPSVYEAVGVRAKKERSLFAKSSAKTFVKGYVCRSFAALSIPLRDPNRECGCPYGVRLPHPCHSEQRCAVAQRVEPRSGIEQGEMESRGVALRMTAEGEGYSWRNVLKSSAEWTRGFSPEKRLLRSRW